MEEMKYHPAAAIFPILSSEELGELAEDIKANGLIEPITLFEGMILDGRNRYEACKLSGIKPRFIELPPGMETPYSWVLGKNLHRRHLTTSQRAAIAAELRPMLMAEAEKRKTATEFNAATGAQMPPPDNKGLTGKSAKIAAEMLGISERIVKEAAAVKKEKPEEFEKIKAGEKTVRAAYVELKSRPLTEREGHLSDALLGRVTAIRGAIKGAADQLLLIDAGKWLEAVTTEHRKATLKDLDEAIKIIRKFKGEIKRRMHVKTNGK